MRILVAGELGPGALSAVRCRSLEAAGAEVHRFDLSPHVEALRTNLLLRAIKRFAGVPFLGRLNRGLLDAFDAARPEVVYIDKGVDIQLETLQEMRRRAQAYGCRLLLVHFHPDDAFHEWLMTPTFEKAFIEYDVHLCPHTWVLDQFRERGVERTLFVPYAYDPESHYRELRFGDASEPQRDVVFVGSWEEYRAGWLEALAQKGVNVHIWGPGWKRHMRRVGDSKLIREGGYATFEEQRRAFGTAKITLGMLSVTNHGGHTTRTFEVPACGGFMLADRTPGQCAFFEEGREMACYEGPDELADKVRYFLDHEDEREAIREAGHRRCIESGYDYDGRMRDVLHEIERLADELRGGSTGAAHR